MNSSLIKSLALLSFAIVCAGCSKHDGSPFNKKRMTELNYVYAPSQTDTSIELSIASALALYSMDPRLFGDPIGIIDSFGDSAEFRPEGRYYGLILSDPNWVPNDSVYLKDRIQGGRVLALTFEGRYERLDSCWNELAAYARMTGMELIPPGIEVYRGQTADSIVAATELIIRVK